MALTAYPSRSARLSASIEKAFGELFTVEAYKPGDDVNGRSIPDISRATFTVVATWRGPATSKTPTARGSASDDSAHNWTATLPSLNVEDAKLLWTIQPGDKVTRLLDGSTFAANPSYANGFGRSTVPLTSRKRWVVVSPSFIPSLDFSDPRNSQYLALFGPGGIVVVSDTPSLDFSDANNSQYLALFGPGEPIGTAGILDFSQSENSGLLAVIGD